MVFQKTPLKLIELPGTSSVTWVKDESYNPTGTFKDRLAWSLTRQLLGTPSRNTLISCITLGNTVKSIGKYFSDTFPENVRPLILGLFPIGFSSRLIGPDTAGKTVLGREYLQHCENLNVKCIEVDLESSFLSENDIKAMAFKTGLDFSFHRDVSYGIGEDAYAVILKESLEEIGTAPDTVIVPVGAGVLFDECVRLVEERGLCTTVLGVSVIKKESVADKIYGYYSPYFKSLVDRNIAAHAKFPRHPVIVVDEQEIRCAIEALSTCGINAEPSAAAAFVPILADRLRGKSFIKGKKILVVNTGNGMEPCHESQ